MRSPPFISLILPVLILMIAPAQAQSNQFKINSLHAVLKANPHDTVKIDSYISLHQAFLRSDTAQSIEYLHKAISTSKRIDDKKRIGRAYLKLCGYLRERGRLPEAKNALNVVKKQLSFLNDIKIEATFYMENGLIHFAEGSYDEAVDSYLNALSRYEALKDSLGIAKSYNNIGNSYWQLENIDNALDYYLKSREWINATDYRALAGNLGNIGLIYRAKKDYDKALSYYQQSLAISREHDLKLDAAITLQNIGVLYQKMGELDSALEYFEESNALSTEINDRIGVLYTSHGIAAILGSMGNYQEAVGRLEQSLQTAKELNIKEEVKNIYLSLSQAYEKMDNYLLALENRKYYETWKDSIANVNYLNQIKELEIKYQTAKKNEKIAVLSRENELRAAEAEQRATWNKILIGGFIFAAIIAGLIIYLLRQRFKNQQLVAAKNQEIKTARFKQQLSELEMKALRAQMNPHFIFNCMNSINRMILSEDTDDASLYLTRFSKLIRLMLENSEKPAVPLQDELAMLEAYIQLEALRFKGKINYRISVDDDIDQENTLVPSMVLQPFIENAIWHGLMHKDGEGLINVTISEDDDLLKCVIEDNGVGREKALELQGKTVVKHESMGLQITEERLKLLSRQEMQDLINITDLKDSVNRAMGTRVDISIPIA